MLQQKYRTLNQLRNTNDVLVETEDKGNGFVIVDKLFYISRMYNV